MILIHKAYLVMREVEVGEIDTTSDSLDSCERITAKIQVFQPGEQPQQVHAAQR